MCRTNPRFITEVEDRIGDSLIEEIIGEVTGLSIKSCNGGNRGYGRGRGKYRRGNFCARGNF